MRFLIALFLFACTVVAVPHASFAQIDLDISVGAPPPAFPVYEQPAPPAPDYIWLPGYWAYDPDDGYYWIPGTWAEAPEPGLLWTPPYWAWNNGNYEFHDGYWGQHVGFYGGINYGYGYSGYGFRGGEWHGDHFENHPMPGPSHSFVGFNGGPGGIQAAPRPQELVAMHEQHVQPTEQQRTHIEAAHQNPALFANQNHGKPPVAATPRPGVFAGQGIVAAKQAGRPMGNPQSSIVNRALPVEPRVQAAPEAQEHAPQAQEFNREDYNTRVITSRPHAEAPPVSEVPRAQENRAPAPQPQHVEQPHMQAPQHLQEPARATAAPHPEARPAEHPAQHAEPAPEQHGDENRGR